MLKNFTCFSQKKIYIFTSIEAQQIILPYFKNLICKLKYLDMNLLLSQLKTTMNTQRPISNITKYLLYLLFFFCWMLNFNVNSAHAKDCPEGDPLQWTWLQDIIALEDACHSGVIRQFEYNENSYFSVAYGRYCGIADFPNYVYNCAGDTVCSSGGLSTTCDEYFPKGTWNSTIIYTYELPIAKTCPEGDYAQWDWVQEKKNSINGCGKTEIIKLTWEDLTIIHFWNACDSSKDQFYDCPIACPEGDPLQWDWMQDLIAGSDECNVEAIHQFEYEGNTYFRTARAGCLLEDKYLFFNCVGEEVCVDGRPWYYSDQCDEEILNQ